MDKKRIYMGLGMLALLIPLIIITQIRLKKAQSNQEEVVMQYQVNEGFIFGTYYRFTYASKDNIEEQILSKLKEFDGELSMFNPESTISKINRSEEVETGVLFESMYATARQVSELTDGAFDITVAPMVNAWGFGTKGKAQNHEIKVVGSQINIDSLREIVGYEKIRLDGHRIQKEDPRIMLDASAIAKGYGCDVVAQVLEDNGCDSYLVDIGGEVVAKGGKRDMKDGKIQVRNWSIGIAKPIDDPSGLNTENQSIIQKKDVAMATSGNYRQFYQDGGVRRSHTIDPRTGYPVQHNLLSATVIADNCMRADALATAAMVMGEEAFIKLIEQIDQAECYLIVGEDNQLKEITSSGWE